MNSWPIQSLLTAVLAVLWAVLGAGTAQAALNVGFQFNGKGNWSIDGVGGNATPVGTISAEVPVGSTVVKAFLYSTMFDGFGMPTAPTVVMDGTTYGPASFVALGSLTGLCCPSTLQLQAFRADVTAEVAAKIGGGSAVPFSFSIDSETPNGNVDGEVLAIIYSNPAELERTIAFLDGATSVAGDTTTFNFASPLDTTTPGFEALMSLGIGFSYQGLGSSQVSLVDGNGRRLTSSAGGEDDGVGSDGGLITVGGLGDSPANPDPLAGSTGPQTDDELYNLALGNSADATPFLLNGDTSFTVKSSNPSANDNIFFMGLNFTARGSVTTGLELSPLEATNNVGQTHTVTVTTTANDLPVSGVTVNLVVSGANSASGSCVTGPDGTCTFSYTGTNVGDDIIAASATVAGVLKTKTAAKVWVRPSNNPPVARCQSITVETDPGACSATVTAGQVDAGSSDPEGLPLTLSLSPAGPYPIGDTVVTLTVMDAGGLTASCPATITVKDGEPPSIVCPGNLTTASSGSSGSGRTTTSTRPPGGPLSGAVVTFSAIGADNCSLVSVVCAPPSGSVFPLGTTSVNCTATDGSGNASSCRFNVTVTPQAAKAQVHNELVALLATVSNSSDRSKLQSAISELNEAVDASLWLDGSHPRPGRAGEEVFGNEKEAVVQLKALRISNRSGIPAATLQGFINRILAVDRALAVTAINDAIARGGRPSKISSAQSSLNKGAADAAADKPDKAIDDYKASWKAALSA